MYLTTIDINVKGECIVVFDYYVPCIIAYCSAGNNNCSVNANCKTNAQTQYTCECKSDYTGNGFNCTREYFILTETAQT